MLRYLLPIFILISLLLPSCKSDSPPQPPAVTDPDFEVDTVLPTGDERYLHEDSDYIFDQDSLYTFELNIPGPSLAKINANPAAEQYVEARLIFQGDTISPVGVRYKGSIGGFVGCVSGSDWTNPSGFKTCTKLSMKVKINWNGREERFFGLKKLQFHSLNLDPTQLRERLGYWLYREMGVPAPRSVHARLIVNGTFSGVYALTEQIDGRFTRYHYDDGKGNLYKEIWPITMDGHAYLDQAYINALKTNEDENPTVERIRGFGEEIAATPPDSMQAVIKKWMKVDEIIAYAVVDRAIRNDDGAFHWYCNGSSCENHNFYWYENPSQNTLHLIPWDLDNAFENIVSNRNPVTPIADDWGGITANCTPFSYGQFQFQQRSAACDKLTAGWASFTEEYEDLLTQFKDGPFAEAQTDALLDAWAAQIRAATLEASQTHSDALKVADWEAAVADLKASLVVARNK